MQIKNKRYIKILITSFIIGLLIPFISQAQIVITEIMYDPQGADSKREWIEIFNSGESDIEITKWFFFENNVYHKITSDAYSMLPAGAYAIIADSIPDFQTDYPAYTGLIFDSAFSLNNTGEPLAMTNQDKETINAFTYSSDMGANGDGNSLQINNGLAISASPTPGQANKTNTETPANSDTNTSSSNTSSSGSTSSSSTNQSTHSNQTPLSNYTVTIPFKVGVGRPRTIPVRTPVEFVAEISKSNGAKRYTWSFGDMNVRTGKAVTHIYEYPGTYNVVLTVKEGDMSATSRTQITVVEPELDIIQTEKTIEIRNVSSKEVNIGNFRLEYLDTVFNIPGDTIISEGQTITLTRQPYQILKNFLYSDQTVYKNVEYTSFVYSTYLWCVQNSQVKECNQRYIAKLFDIIKGWLS